MKSPDVASLVEVASTCPGFQARAAARALTRFYNSYFRPFGITAEQFSLMVGIGATREPTLAQLAEEASIDPTTLSRSVQTLQKSGLVASIGGGGRRGKQLSLTEDGKALLEKAYPAWRAARDELARRAGAQVLIDGCRVMSQLRTIAD